MTMHIKKEVEKIVHLSAETKQFMFGGVPMLGNTENGAVVGLTASGKAVVHALCQGEIALKDAQMQEPNLMAYLGGHDFLCEGEVCAPQKHLRAAYLHVTQRCNLGCAGCYSFDANRNRVSDATLSDELHAIDELAICGVNHLIISGGEPFLRDDLGALVRHASEYMSEISVLTNGTVRNDDALRVIADCGAEVAVSFDGANADAPAYIREKQRFSELVAFVQHVVMRGIPVVVTATIHARNIDDMPVYAQLAEKLGAKVNFSLLSPTSNGFACNDLYPVGVLEQCAHAIWDLSCVRKREATIESLGGGLRCRANCGAGMHEISIDAAGNVYPCHMMHDMRYSMGNVFKHPLSHIMQGQIAKEFAALDVDEFETCASCFAAPLCGGGCRARAVAMGNGLQGPDGYCELNKVFYTKLNSQLSKLAKE